MTYRRQSSINAETQPKSSEAVMQFNDAERRKLYFRSCHRGIKEMDLIFSRFAERVLADLPDSDLADYALVLDLPDDKLFAWITGREAVPETIRSPVLNALLSLDYMDDADFDH